ncbi:MAG: VacJ family lipoprotein [Rhodospirillales bacterium]|nr:MAG: VacJ family lipoprotein [Rhodospirillales bacterium]
MAATVQTVISGDRKGGRWPVRVSRLVQSEAVSGNDRIMVESMFRPLGWSPLGLSKSLAVVVIMAALITGGCATRPDPREDPEAYAEYVEINDPLEPFNRAVFEFNRAFDTMLLKPLAIFYRDILPPPLTRGINNTLNNLRSPVIFFNDLLQGRPDRAGTTLARFMINSTLGVGGVHDAATNLGWERHEADFGQTLAVWGLGEGPFLMLPILGPSNPRDAVGLGVDSAVLDPLGFINIAVSDPDTAIKVFNYARTGTYAVDRRSQVIDALDDLERTSLDFYAALRSAVRQSRRSFIEEGRQAPVSPTPLAP